jgi:hypothetical protein
VRLRRTQSRPASNAGIERIYVYKICTDDGDAPCVQDGLLTLAICKPMIRTAAPVDSYVVAFASNGLNPDNHLVYAARVTAKLVDGAYYRDAKYMRRRDCIYEWINGKYTTRKDARAHQDNVERNRDLGRPDSYRRACVLLSRDFRYFSKDAVVPHQRYGRIVSMLRRLNQGLRVNHSDRLADELRLLLAEAWRHESRRQVDRLDDDGACGGCRPKKHRAHSRSC